MTQIEERQLLYKILIAFTSIVISVTMGVSSYFIKENINSITQCQKDIIELKLNAEKVNGNRFTSGDFVKAKEIIDQQQLSIDRRVTILEENMRVIKDLMTEIKTDVKEIKEGHYSEK